MRDDLCSSTQLRHRLAQLADDFPLVRGPELDEVDRVAHEQADIVEGIVQFMSDAADRVSAGDAPTSPRALPARLRPSRSPTASGSPADDPRSGSRALRAQP